jgi:hypothetical protein
MSELKLVALDAENLAILSAHLQDAVLLVGDMAYIPADRRFVALMNRFDWAAAQGVEGGRRSIERCRTAFRLERVLDAKTQGVDLRSKRQVLSLLAIQFEENDAPSGVVTLIFAGGGAIRLRVECIEAELRDLGAAWKARRQPVHPGDDAASSS